MKHFYRILAIFIAMTIANTAFANQIDNPFQNRLQAQLNQNISELKNNSENIIASQNSNQEKEDAQTGAEIQTKNPWFVMEFDSPKKYEISFEDSSLYRFVGVNHPLNAIKYAPENLVTVNGKYVFGGGKLRLEAKKSLDELAEEFYKQFKRKIKIVSAYRSYADQEGIAKRNPLCVKNGFCAKPGHSEHQLGLAIDIEGLQAESFTHGKYRKYYDFMKENAHKYGWTQSYQKWREIDGYGIEPWHWRYIGTEIATELKEQWKTLTEFALQK